MKPHTLKEHSLNAMTVRELSHNLLEIVYRDNYEVSLEDIRELLDQLNLWTERSAELKIISIAGHFTSITPAARHLLEGTNLGLKAEAIVVNELPQRIIVRYYTRIAIQDLPVKSFKNRNEALEWLEQI